jgi:excisionase family DNA binding protein
MTRLELLTAAEAATMLRIKESTLREHTRRGLIPHLRIGRAVRYDAADLAAWLETRKRPMDAA